MKHLRLLAALCTLGGALSACGQSPTLSTAPDRARMDGGFTYGSGHFTEGSSGTSPTSTSTVTAGSTMTAEDCTAGQRGGWSLGSGKLAEPVSCEGAAPVMEGVLPSTGLEMVADSTGAEESYTTSSGLCDTTNRGIYTYGGGALVEMTCP